MLANRKVRVLLLLGEVYEGIMRKSEMPDFLHIESHIDGSIEHRYIPMERVRMVSYSRVMKKRTVEASIVKFSRKK